MAFSLCPLSCIAKTKRKPNVTVSADVDKSNVMWDALCPMVFCSDVFPPSFPIEEATDMSKTCWYCHVDSCARGKFIARKSCNAIPEEILRIQEELDFTPGEPLTKHNIHKIIPTGKHRKCKEDPPFGSPSQAKVMTPLRIVSPNNQSCTKRKFVESGGLPPKKYASDSYGNAVCKAISRHRTSEYKSMKSRFSLNSTGLASV